MKIEFSMIKSNQFGLKETLSLTSQFSQINLSINMPMLQVVQEYVLI